MVNWAGELQYVFDRALEGKFIDRMDQNQEIFARYMERSSLRQGGRGVVDMRLARKRHARTPQKQLFCDQRLLNLHDLPDEPTPLNSFVMRKLESAALTCEPQMTGNAGPPAGIGKK